MAYLEVKVHNSFGTWVGKITLSANSDPGHEKVVMRELIGGINTMEMLAIETDDGESTIFGQSVIRQSVVTVKSVS